MLKKNNIGANDVDMYLFHQGSYFMVTTLAKMLGLDNSKYVYDINDYGNTVSSSIPILLEHQIPIKENKLLMASGFGVGLSWANVLFRRVV